MHRSLLCFALCASLALAAKPASARESPAAAPASKLSRSIKSGALSSHYADLALLSQSAMVSDQRRHVILYAKNPDIVQPIASITKLMTAIVVLDSQLRLNEEITITAADFDNRRYTGSRLRPGTKLPRAAMLRIMLMASDNRAANALARTAPGGATKFVARMNMTAERLGLTKTMFADPSGLSTANVSTARDLTTLVHLAYQYPIIREYSTTPHFPVVTGSGRNEEITLYHNTNLLTRDMDWHLGLSKTGFINESGQCLVLQAIVGGKPVVIVLLDSWGKFSRIGDANRVKKWLERYHDRMISAL